MYFYRMRSTDIRDNLATEQYLMNNVEFDVPLVLFYIQKPCIIVGRHQNTLEEINSDYVKKHNITITRRFSGGGAVYDDLGNISFSFVVNSDSDNFGNFKKLTKPIIDALKDMGATTAEVSGRNDLMVDGKKFSGNAMYTKNGKMFSHGTLAYDVDLTVLSKALNVPKDKIESKGIKSVKSRVTNVKPYLKPEYQKLTTEEFRDRLIMELFHTDNLNSIANKEYKLTEADKTAIQKLNDDYYYNWDWVYGKSPDFTVKNRKHFNMGTIDVRYEVSEGKIKSLEIYGDYFGKKDSNDIKQKLIGIDYDSEQITKVLKTFDLDNYFSGVSENELFTLFTK
ncbi:lipoate--protein ligase [Companilactobacillus ginsenosidimutans]|uniref:lipoate--protein ligase n=1 Tax=Companilactobacillus ginsenosidimutans TaxID=1007676 RepID=A0A0H4QYM3_9LACO|nr:lipoate--protein ligase [Companilactobacillus ginsenosidimutans]AKP66580.1 lipoate--protein ligase [Companilactobacillus ginsenosidimutans]